MSSAETHGQVAGWRQAEKQAAEASVGRKEQFQWKGKPMLMV